MKFFALLFCYIIIGTGLVQAEPEVLDFYVWQSGETISPFLLPVPKGEAPEKAAERYLQALTKNADLMDLFLGERPQLSPVGFTRITQLGQFVLSIANKGVDYSLDSLRVKEFKRIFQQAGYQHALLPMGLDLYLSRGQVRALMHEISSQVPVLNSMGGDDVHPHMYRQTNFHSTNINQTRDRFEIEMIRQFTSAQKGFFIGVCRGAQIAAVSLGYKLVQDIPFQLGTATDHGDTWHPIEVKKTSYNYLYSIFQGKKHSEIRSIHHQMIAYKPGGPLELAAVGPDGVVEALEFKNGRGILMQFHPELMQNSFGDSILTQVLRQEAQVRRAPKCGGLFL